MRSRIGEAVTIILKTGVKIAGKVNNVVELGNEGVGAYEFIKANGAPLSSDQLSEVRYIQVGGLDALYSIATDPTGGGISVMREIFRLEANAYQQDKLRTEIQTSDYSLNNTLNLSASTEIRGMEYTFSGTIEYYRANSGLGCIVRVTNLSASPDNLDSKYAAGHVAVDVEVSVRNTIGRLAGYSPNWDVAFQPGRDYLFEAQGQEKDYIESHLNDLVLNVYVNDIDGFGNKNQIGYCELSEGGGSGPQKNAINENGSEQVDNSNGGTVPTAQNQVFKDPRDGQVYPTIDVDGKTWLAANFRYKPSVGQTWCFDCGSNGLLYDWAAAKAACPPGWHLPSKDEWLSLIHHIKREGNLFHDLTTGGASGFNAELAGWYQYVPNPPELNFEGTMGVFWTSEVNPASHNGSMIFAVQLDSRDAQGPFGVVMSFFDYRDGLSVRYVKDNNP